MAAYRHRAGSRESKAVPDDFAHKGNRGRRLGQIVSVALFYATEVFLAAGAAGLFTALKYQARTYPGYF